MTRSKSNWTSIATGLLGILLWTCTSCSRPGAEFVGGWENASHSGDRIVIARNGDQFLLTTPDGTKIGAVFKDGQLEVAGAMGVVRITHIKATDTLTAPGFFGSSEYRRASDAKAQPSREQTLDSAMKSGLHDAQMAMEAFWGYNKNSYRGATVDALKRHGFQPKLSVTIEISAATDRHYILKATAAGTVHAWVLDPSTGLITPR